MLNKLNYCRGDSNPGLPAGLSRRGYGWWRSLSLVLLLLGSAFSLQAKVSLVADGDLSADRANRQAALIMTRVMEKYHYKKVALDDAFSEKIYKRYLESLDPNRSFFTAKDIQRFDKYRDALDDALHDAHLEAAFDIFRTYRKRVGERVDYVLHRLDGKFSFDRDEDYQFDREDAPWAADKAALDELWRKRVKNDVLSLKLAGKPMEKIRKTLRQRYLGIKRRTYQLNSNDVFQLFANAYAASLEPHTGYMSPRSSENFDISMRLSLEGIGAVLKTDNEYTVVQRTVPGGPAALDGRLKRGDRIVGVAQGRHGKMVDIVGWRLQDVVERIRGPKDSVVRLEILPKHAITETKTKLVELVRNKVKLEDQAVKSRVIKDLDGLHGMRIGVIEIPTFYRDFAAEGRGDSDFRSTTRDVRKLLKKLKGEKVDGIVIDLRGNGGGALSEAVELTGLFIPSGPVVQVRDSSGDVNIENDPDPAQVYSGPLAVLVDRNSASASEIFSGAIQDYKRGLILGEPTFGKGTVQTLIDLDRFVRSGAGSLGRLRLTMAQFFRVNGGSTQYRGVVPDVPFPTVVGGGDYGERAYDNALPWAHIKPAPIKTTGLGSVSQLLDGHYQRISHDPGFDYLIKTEKELAEARDRKTVSLLESKRRQEWESREKRQLENRNRFRETIGLPAIADAHQSDGDKSDAQVDDDEKESEAIRNIEVSEAARILADFIKSCEPPVMTAMRKEKW